jgi:hypothetical protein
MYPALKMKIKIIQELTPLSPQGENSYLFYFRKFETISPLRGNGGDRLSNSYKLI